jgi:dihydropteroate synthase type 2
VLRGLRARGAAVSVDTRKPEVMHAALALGAAWLNDVDGFRSADAMAVVRAAPRATRFVAMFSRSERGRAGRPAAGTDDLLAAIRAFFADRVAAFAAAGVARDRLVLDPGMGFFLGAAPAHSLLVLKHLPALQREFAPLLVSVSRKSFVGALTGASAGERGPGTLAAELWAVRAGVEWVRTHDVGALRAALAVEQAIEGSA